jgi:hypothetical protein
MVTRPHDVPRARGWPGRAVVELLATGWLVLQGLARAGLWLLGTVDAGTSAVARSAGRALRATVRALGPAGRWLVQLLAPLLRGLRRAWAWLNRRVLLGMARGLGRSGRWLVRRSRPVVAVVRRWLVRARPLLRRLESAAAAVARVAARLGRSLARILAPALRTAAAVRRRTRSAWAPVAARLRARG